MSVNLHEQSWRNGRDSNPRGLHPHAFKARAFVHSATVPWNTLPPAHRPTTPIAGQRRYRRVGSQGRLRMMRQWKAR